MEILNSPRLKTALFGIYGRIRCFRITVSRRTGTQNNARRQVMDNNSRYLNTTDTYKGLETEDPAAKAGTEEMDFLS